MSQTSLEDIFLVRIAHFATLLVLHNDAKSKYPFRNSNFLLVIESKLTLKLENLSV